MAVIKDLGVSSYSDKNNLMINKVILVKGKPAVLNPRVAVSIELGRGPNHIIILTD